MPQDSIPAEDHLAAAITAAFPRIATLRDGAKVNVRPFAAADREQVCAFFERVPEDDRAFLKEDVINRAEVEAWLSRLDPATETMVVAEKNGSIIGAAVLGREAHGWARHVGEIRIVADPSARRLGLGHVL
ncbi:MAG: GNAT family N-acetyltransferase, partial [Candidatus Binataceae bacterium]